MDIIQKELLKSKILKELKIETEPTTSNIMNYICDIVTIIQKYSSKDITGSNKKELVIELIKEIISTSHMNHELKDFIDNYIDNFIDVIILCSRNKEMIKVFKKKCQCIPF